MTDSVQKVQEKAKPAIARLRTPSYMASGHMRNLPQYYYHANFCEMLHFIRDKNHQCLTASHKEFISQFFSLPFPAQCLYVRLSGRKSCVFNGAKLAYEDIGDLTEPLVQLETNKLTTAVDAAHYKDFLSALTKPDLIDVIGAHISGQCFRKSWAKPRLIDLMITQIDFPDLNPACYAGFIVQGAQDEMDFFRYLYFGRIEQNLQNFTMRDLGLVKPANLKTDYGARFDDVKQAQCAFFYAKALDTLEYGDDAQLDRLETLNWPNPLCPVSRAGHDKLLQKLGRRAERLGKADTALAFYAQSQSPLCAERRIRIRYKRGAEDDRRWVKTELERMIDDPLSDESYHFARDFYARKFFGKRTSQMTDILREGRVLNIDEAYRNQPERAAQRLFNQQGYAAYRSENYLWRTLFGLYFWTELFDPQTASLHNSFERLPRGLKTGTFYTAFKERIEIKLTRLESGTSIFMDLVRTTAQNYGQVNGIFRWSKHSLDMLKMFLLAAPPRGLAQILRAMAQDYSNMKDGFPDLLLIKQGKARLTEIKASGDVLRRNQLTRISQLRSAGFETDITRINWVIDPNQIYVVVDVETTGGRAGLHRVTEIGAVKMQGGEIIGEWQSLLNPERSIPAAITRLTGISLAMVANAPCFYERADSFRAFMDGSIFSAHNVNFDYGFIAHEFGRIGQHFRYPKICTCASMRRLYPGHKSYSLKNLCAAYNIDLSSHHRALCDAKAAARLLNLVNLRRIDMG